MFTTDNLVASSNMMVFLVYFMQGGLVLAFLWQLRNSPDFSKGFLFLLIGYVIEKFSWAFHRLYWWKWRDLRDKGLMLEADAYVDFAWVTVFMLLAACIGSSMMTVNVSPYFFGKRWFLIMIAVIFGIYSIVLVL